MSKDTGNRQNRPRALVVCLSDLPSCLQLLPRCDKPQLRRLKWMEKTRKKSLSYKYCKRYTCRMVEILLPFLATRPNTSEQTWSATRQMRHQEISGLSHCPLTADRVLWPSSVLTARLRDRFQKLSSHPSRLLAMSSLYPLRPSPKPKQQGKLQCALAMCTRRHSDDAEGLPMLKSCAFK